MKSVVSLSDAISKVKSSDIVGISGFLGVGEPFELIEELVKQNQQDLTLVSVVTSHPGKEVGVGRLCENHQVKNYIAAHLGTSAASPCSWSWLGSCLDPDRSRNNLRKRL